jgi:hypothetical protein
VRLHQRLQLCVFQQDVQQVTGSVSHTLSSITGCWQLDPLTWLSGSRRSALVKGTLPLSPWLFLHPLWERITGHTAGLVNGVHLAKQF